MIYPDRAEGVKLVTDPVGTKAMHHSLRHAPTPEQGKDVVIDAFRAKRGERYIQSLQFTRRD